MPTAGKLLALGWELSGGCRADCLHVPCPCGPGFWQCDSIFRPKGSCSTSSVLALDVRQSPFRHILWAKVQPGFKGVNIGGCGSLGTEEIFFGDKMSISRA